MVFAKQLAKAGTGTFEVILKTDYFEDYKTGEFRFHSESRYNVTKESLARLVEKWEEDGSCYEIIHSDGRVISYYFGL